jgi:predicted RNase H-like HicB family nuclease
MDHLIVTSREPDGRWVATVPQFPGMAAYGQSRQEVRVLARKLCALLLDENTQHKERILAFFPGEIPPSFRAGLAI